MTFELVSVNLHKESTSYISVLYINGWHLFYWQKEPKHAGGKMTFLTLFGIRVIKK